MAAEVVDEGSGHPASAGLALIEQGLDQVLGTSTWSLSDAQVEALVVRLTGVAARTEAARAAAVRESVSRESPDARGERGARTVSLLRSACRLSPQRARADVKNAVLTCPDTGTFRELGAALAAGEVSRQHVDVARTTLNRLPARLVRERRDDLDHLITQHARTWDPGTADTLSRHLVSVVAPDRADRYDEDALDRRHVGVVTDQTGMVLVSGQLDQVGGLTFVTVLDHFVDQDRASENDADAAVDVRTRGQRRADALVRMAQAAAEHDGVGSAARAVPRVVVVTTPEQLAGAEGAGAAVTTDGTLVGRGALVRLACDAVVDRVVLGRKGRVLAMDTVGRLATAAQQAALAARDGGCTWPGCTAPPSLCEAHHVTWWSPGGPPSIDNLALLCHRHHTLVHAQEEDGWEMVVSDGRPWFRPPDWLDPDRTLVRNTWHEAVEATRRTALRWRASLTEGDPGPDPP
jgi:hypothetical protein